MPTLTIQRNDEEIFDQRQRVIQYSLYDLWNRDNAAKPLELLDEDITMSGTLATNICSPLSRNFRVLVASTANTKGLSEQLDEVILMVPQRVGERELLRSWDDYLSNHWQELLEQFKEKYVAVWDNEVIDSDEDLGRLAERVYARMGYRPIFMPYISDAEQAYEFLVNI